MQEHTIHDIELILSDDMTWTEMNLGYQSFLTALVAEIESLVVGGSFASADELNGYLSEVIENFSHVYTPSLAKKYMSLTRNAASFMRELSRYDMVPEEQFFYQLAYFAQVADLKAELEAAGVYDWFYRHSHREAVGL